MYKKKGSSDGVSITDSPSTSLTASDSSLSAVKGSNNISTTQDDGVKFSRKRDEEYKAAVERGDEKKAGELVRDAAAEAMPDTKVVDADGKPLVVYHGTPIAGFTEFYTEESLAWVSVSEDQAKIMEVTMSLKKDFIQTIR